MATYTVVIQDRGTQRIVDIEAGSARHAEAKIRGHFRGVLKGFEVVSVRKASVQTAKADRRKKLLAPHIEKYLREGVNGESAN